MCRDVIITQLEGSPHEQLLKSHLLAYCPADSSPLKVVSEIDVFLVKYGYISLIGYLDPTACIDHIVIDFNDVIVPCLKIGGSYVPQCS